MAVVNVYRPPNGTPSRALEFIRTCLKSYDNLHKREIVIMGDLNINLLHPNFTGSKQLKELCRDFNLTQLIETPTKITQATKTLLDIIITNMNFIKVSGVHDYVISDHLPVFGVRKKQ